jgi:predicted Fe-Mo cluster-binding NifX family protein
MKIAIPLFGAYVAPRFDSAERILLITVENMKVMQREEVAVPPGPFFPRFNRILALNPDVLICGNIDGFSGRMIVGRGVRLIPRIIGETEGVIKKFLSGELEAFDADPDGWCRSGMGNRPGRRGRGKCGRQPGTMRKGR